MLLHVFWGSIAPNRTVLLRGGGEGEDVVEA